MLTKSEARGLIRQWLDDPNSKQWSDANLDLLTTLVLDDLWGEILSVAPNYTSKLETLGSGNITSPGYIDLSDAGPLSLRFHKIQSVVRDEYEYGPADPRSVVIEDGEVVVSEFTDYRYFVRGEELWLFPLGTSDEVELRYSYRPAKFNGLASGDNVEWPDGYESAYVLEAAGRAMLKGGRENDGARDLLAMANATFERLLARVQKLHPGPITPYTTRPADEWGSVE